METLTEFSPGEKRALISLIHSRIEEKLRDQLPTREDFSELKSIVQELARSQQELAQAQKHTEKELRNLARQVGGLSDRLGGSLEDLSYDVLPACIEKYHGIEVDELGRDFIPFYLDSESIWMPDKRQRKKGFTCLSLTERSSKEKESD